MDEIVSQINSPDWQENDAGLNKLISFLPLISQDEALALVKLILDSLSTHLKSLRTTLILSSCSAVKAISNSLLSLLDPYSDRIFTVLLKVASQPKKIACNAALDSLSTLIHNSSFHSRNLAIFVNSIDEKNTATRLVSITCIKTFLSLVNRDNKHLYIPTGIELIEKSLRKGIVDADSFVRDSSRLVYQMYKDIWSDKAELFPCLI